MRCRSDASTLGDSFTASTPYPRTSSSRAIFEANIKIWNELYGSSDAAMKAIVTSKTLASLASTKERKTAVKSLANLWALAKDNLDLIQQQAGMYWPPTGLDGESRHNRDAYGGYGDEELRLNNSVIISTSTSDQFQRRLRDSAGFHRQKNRGALKCAIAAFGRDNPRLLHRHRRPARALRLDSSPEHSGLGGSMKRYGSGDFTARERVGGNDEFGSISEQLNDMVGSFSRSSPR